MKDLGADKKILGMEIHRDHKAGKLYLFQRKYLKKVLVRFNMSDYKLVSSPLVTHFKLSSESCLKSEEEIKKCLMFLILLQLVVSCML